MTNTQLLITMSLIGLAAVISVIMLINYVRVNLLNPSGRGANKKTRRILRRYAATRNYKVLEDILLEHDGNIIPIDTMLVGFFGILLVDTLGARGEYYGAVDDAEWVFIPDDRKNQGKRETIPNPLISQNKATQSLRQIFSEHRIYNVPVDKSIVVMNSSKKTAVFITQKDLVFSKKEFKQYLSRVKFDKDNEVNVEELSSLIVEHSHENEARRP